MYIVYCDFSTEKIIVPCSSCAPFVPPNLCTPTKSDLYQANSLAAAVSEPALYRLLMFHVPNKMSLFLCLVRDASSTNTPHQRSEWGSILPSDCFVSRWSISPMSTSQDFFSRGGVVSISPNPQAGGPPLVVFPRLLIQFICSYPPYQRPFLHPHPEDVPCRGDRDPKTH